MEQPAPTKPTRPKSKSSLPTTPLPVPSHTVASPELLQTIQGLQTEIEELRKRRGLTDEEQAELVELKTDLAETRAELKASRVPASAPISTRSRRIVNYGTFCTVEEHASDE